MDVKIEPVVKSSKKSPELKKMDLLVHVNYYDSHNCEKQYEFVCYSEQTVLNLVEKFKCLIEILGNEEIMKRRN